MIEVMLYQNVPRAKKLAIRYPKNQIYYDKFAHYNFIRYFLYVVSLNLYFNANLQIDRGSFIISSKVNGGN